MNKIEEIPYNEETFELVGKTTHGVAKINPPINPLKNNKIEERY